MAVGVRFPQANAALHPPPGAENDVYTLPIHFNGQRVVSCWELTPDELARIVLTRRVWLSVWGASAPPCLVEGAMPEHLNAPLIVEDLQRRKGAPHVPSK